MRLSSEHQRLWEEEIARSRAALSEWREKWPKFYNTTTEARVAVADHLTACEALLREIGRADYHAENRQWLQPEPVWIAQVHLEDWLNWQAKARALLGPAPQKDA